MNLLSRFIRKIPPFRNIYRRIDALKKENATIKKAMADREKDIHRLSKQVDMLLSAQQEAEKTMRGLNNATAANEKRWQTVAEQERRDYSALQKAVAAANATAADRDKRNYEQLRDSITKANQTAAERERQDYSKLMRQIGDNRYQLSRKDEYYYFKGLEPSRYPDALKEWYYQKTGQTLNLEHPRTYTEKIQWLKLHDSTPLKGELSDKYLVRNYVKQKIGEEYLVPLLGVWDRAEDIPFDALPVRFALKATHGSGWNIIVHDKSSLNVADARRKLNEWLQTNFAFYAGLELHYGYIKPRIIAEEYIENSGGDIDDYKVFCFDGKPRYILFITGRHTHMEKAVYDTDRNRMPFLDGGRPLERDVSKPAFLSKLLSLAEALSQGFIHVRVDFYCLNSGQLKFGEMTFTPTSGRSLWEPAEYERILGDLIHLPCDDQPQE